MKLFQIFKSLTEELTKCWFQRHVICVERQIYIDDQLIDICTSMHETYYTFEDTTGKIYWNLEKNLVFIYYNHKVWEYNLTNSEQIKRCNDQITKVIHNCWPYTEDIETKFINTLGEILLELI